MLLEEFIEKNKDLLPKKYGDIILPYRLVDKGDKMMIKLVCYGSDNAAFVITHNSLSAGAVSETVELQMQPDGDDYFAELEMEFNEAGNTRLELWCSGQRLVRQVAVIDKGYMAVIPWVGSNVPMVDDEIHRFDIPGDFWIKVPLFDTHHEKTVKNLCKYIENVYKYGDRVACFVNGKALCPEAKTDSLFELDKQTQEDGLKRIFRILQMLGVEKPELFASYTPDAVAIGILEELGVKGLTSLCVWQNYMDDGWKINHQGASNQPYYPSADDFRKAGEKRNIMCFSMGNSSCNRNYSIMAYDACPSNVSPGQRYFSNRVVHHQVQRFYDAFDSYIFASKQSEGLVTVTVAIESFKGFSDWNAANEQAIRYMIKKATQEKIVFVSSADVADYHIRKGIDMQTAYFFQPDFYYGYHNGELPGCVDDRMEVDSPEYLAVIRRGGMRPMYFFDYTDNWDNAEFDDENRNEFGLINPDKHDPSECSPKQVDSRDMEFSYCYEGNELIVTVKSQTVKKRMVTGIFDIPFEADFEFSVDKKDAFAKKIYDIRGGNTHLFIDLGEIPEGETVVRIKIRGKKRECDRYEYICNGLGIMDFGSHAYIRSVDKDAAISVTLKDCENAYIIRQDGKRIFAQDGVLAFSVNSDWYDEAPILYGYSSDMLKTLSAEVKVTGKTMCNRWSWDRN